MDALAADAPVGLIAGHGRSPFLAANGIRAAGRRLVVVGLKGLASPWLMGRTEDHAWCGMARVGHWAGALRKWNIDMVRFARERQHPVDYLRRSYYESWLAGPHKIVVHRSSCGQCNHGKGRPAGHEANHARWHGPYVTLAEARSTAQQMTGVLIRSECKCI